MAIDLAEKSSGPTPEFLASSPPDNSKCGGKLSQGHMRPQGLRSEPWSRETAVVKRECI